MLTVLLTAMALATEPVVVIGDGLVVAPPEAATAAPSTGSWVAAVGDCLEESRPGEFRVVDRVAPGETVRSAAKRVAEVRDLTPAIVVVGLGARELGASKPDGQRFKKDLAKLVGQLRAADSDPKVVLVGMIAPSKEQAPDQLTVDQQATDWNRVIEGLAVADDRISHVDLWADWPKDGEQRRSLTASEWELSDQGHARVAAAVCDAI